MRNACETAGEDVRRFQAGDREAAERLAWRACRLALRTAAAILNSRDQAADVAQDVAVDVLASIGKLRDPEAFEPWVHRITVRHTMRRARRQRLANVTETPLGVVAETDQPSAPDGPDVTAVLAARAALRMALVQLPPKQQIALALRYVHDLSDAQIAEALGCRLGTAHALLSRGRATLRQHPRLAEFAPATSGGHA
jgi:RNA polymerase sigma factor (sigma-70 family)